MQGATGSMMAKHRRGSSTASRAAIAVATAVAVGAVATGAVVVGGRFTAKRSDASTTAPTPRSSQSSTQSSDSASSKPSPVAVPLHVVSTTPDGKTPVTGTEPITVTFDAPVAANSPLPTISPQTPGSWSRPAPRVLRFVPALPFVPGTAVSVAVPATMRSVNGGTLGSDAHASFQVGDGSLLRLQQLLAELHYLPLTFTPDSPEPNAAATQGAFAFDPPDGQFAMRFVSTPAALAALWLPGKMTALTKGAVMAFENVHHLDIDGIAGPAVWSALLADAVSGTVDPQPYTWAWTTMARPETLQIWSDGEFVFSSKANTGIAAAPTPKGSWPVFARYHTQTMTGTNPDGTKYSDPGVPYISYFYQGDAIHGFKRASYGSPQSLGCVELPYSAAAQVWSLIDYGTVVTVSS